MEKEMVSEENEEGERLRKRWKFEIRIREEGTRGGWRWGRR